jgi:hypothetical protein
MEMYLYEMYYMPVLTAGEMRFLKSTGRRIEWERIRNERE